MPIPRRKLCERADVHIDGNEDNGMIPTYRHALSIANIPPRLWCAPEEAAQSKEKKATMPVAVI